MINPTVEDDSSHPVGTDSNGDSHNPQRKLQHAGKLRKEVAKRGKRKEAAKSDKWLGLLSVIFSIFSLYFTGRYRRASKMSNPTAEGAPSYHAGTDFEGDNHQTRRKPQRTGKLREGAARKDRVLVIVGVASVIVAVLTFILSIISLKVTSDNGIQQVLYQQDQGLVQMTISLQTSWNDTFTIENRLRFERFRARIKEWEKNPNARDKTLTLLIKNETVSDPDRLKTDDGVMDLISQELGVENIAEARAQPRTKIVEAAFRYRNTIINCINTMEAIYIIRSYSGSKRTVSIIDAQHSQIIELWVRDLEPFFTVYRGIYDEKPQAWNILTNYVQHVQPQ